MRVKTHSPLQHQTWLLDWAAEWFSLGIHTILAYTMWPDPLVVAASASQQAFGGKFQLINVSWMLDFDVHDNGQLWTSHDCLYRAREQGFAWAFYFDFDELIRPGCRKQPASDPYLHELVSQLEQSGKTQATFGSVPYITTYCSREPGLSLPGRMIYRATNASACDHCLGPSAQRKFCIKLDKHHTVAVHRAEFDGVLPPHDSMQFPAIAGQPYMKHLRNAPFNGYGDHAPVCSQKFPYAECVPEGTGFSSPNEPGKAWMCAWGGPRMLGPPCLLERWTWPRTRTLPKQPSGRDAMRAT